MRVYLHVFFRDTKFKWSASCWDRLTFTQTDPCPMDWNWMGPNTGWDAVTKTKIPETDGNRTSNQLKGSAIPVHFQFYFIWGNFSAWHFFFLVHFKDCDNGKLWLQYFHCFLGLPRSLLCFGLYWKARLKFLYFKLLCTYITGIKHLDRQFIAYNSLRDIISHICDQAQCGKFFYFTYYSSWGLRPKRFEVPGWKHTTQGKTDN